MTKRGIYSLTLKDAGGGGQKCPLDLIDLSPKNISESFDENWQDGGCFSKLG